MKDVSQEEGRTVLFVSHDLGAVGRLCNRGIWMDSGEIRADGGVDEVVRQYLGATAGQPSSAEFTDVAGGPIRLEAARVAATAGADSEIIRRDEPLEISLTFTTVEPVRALNLSVYVMDQQGNRILDDALGDAPRGAADFPRGRHTARVTLPPLLPAGEYTLGLWFGSAYEEYIEREILAFQIWPRGDDPEEAGGRPRVVQPMLRWEVGEL